MFVSLGILIFSLQLSSVLELSELVYTVSFFYIEAQCQRIAVFNENKQALPNADAAIEADVYLGSLRMIRTLVLLISSTAAFERKSFHD